MKEGQKRVKFCPKCGSTNINFTVFYRPSIWRCLDCGYEGVFMVEDCKLTEKVRKKFALEEWGIEVPEFLGSTPAWFMPPTS
jgi:ribosomal protein L37AE/L43A